MDWQMPLMVRKASAPACSSPKRAAKRRFMSPAAATVYRTLEPNVGWRCTICGYVAERETLPDGYQCPICRANRDKFVKV